VIAEPIVIRNGWDPETAPVVNSEPTDLLDSERTSLVYTGRFGTFGRDPRPLVEALSALAARDPNTAANLELVIAGPLTAEEARLFDADVAPARIVTLGSLERDRALALQREADVLLLIAHPTRSQLLNIKLFEYLATGRPILALAAGTEAGRVIEEARAGEAVRADDPATIAGALAQVARGELAPPPADAVAPFVYPAPAEAMADAVEAAIAAHLSSR
jgi:glycosyltransferase involved in cell wall biosynthesis